jgi:hypothetical protein
MARLSTGEAFNVWKYGGAQAVKLSPSGVLVPAKPSGFGTSCLPGGIAACEMVGSR